MGEGPRGRRPDPAARDRRGQGERARPDPRSAGRGSSRARRARCRTARASAEFPEAKRLLGAVANSRGHRHEENVAKLVQVAKALPLEVGAALLASAEGYTPRANDALDRAREELGTIQEIANALADNLPAPKAPARKSRRRKRKKKPGEGQAQPAAEGAAASNGGGARRGRRRGGEAEAATTSAQARPAASAEGRPPATEPPAAE